MSLKRTKTVCAKNVNLDFTFGLLLIDFGANKY